MNTSFNGALLMFITAQVIVLFRKGIARKQCFSDLRGVVACCSQFSVGIFKYQKLTHEAPLCINSPEEKNYKAVDACSGVAAFHHVRPHAFVIPVEIVHICRVGALLTPSRKAHSLLHIPKKVDTFYL
jgi:hypothetical protein